MSIDRAAILRRAETLLQQGKLEAAIAEYRRIVDEQPEDWTTANILGDLYIRAGQNDKAVEQFVRIADHLQRQGFLPKAAALIRRSSGSVPTTITHWPRPEKSQPARDLLVDANAYLKSALRAPLGQRRSPWCGGNSRAARFARREGVSKRAGPPPMRGSTWATWAVR